MKKSLNLALALGLSVSSVVPGQVIAKEKENVLQGNNEQKNLPSAKQSEKVEVKGWNQDPQTVRGGELLEQTSDDWIHIKAGPNNGNSAGDSNSYPAVFLYQQKFDFNQPGYITAKVKSNIAGSENRFGFYLGYKDPGNGLFIGYDAGGWFWQKYKGGDGAWYTGNRKAAPKQGEENLVRIEWDEHKKAKVIIDNETIFSDLDFSGLTMTDTVGVKAGKFNNSLTDVSFKIVDTSDMEKYSLFGTVVDDENKPVEGAYVTIAGFETHTDKDGKFEFIDVMASGTYDIQIQKEGFNDYKSEVTIEEQNLTINGIKLTKEEINVDTIKSESMQVEVNKDFPSVRKYEMLNYNNKVMYGQTKTINTVEINGKNIALNKDNVDYKKIGDNKASYTLKVKDSENNIDAIVTVEMFVEGNTLDFNVVKIENNMNEEKFPIQTISFPNHSLISVRSNQKDASLTGAVMSSDTNKNGDETFDITKNMSALNNRDYMYAFISGDGLSAGMWSNSEHNGRAVATPVSGGSQNTRIYATTSKVADETSVGLASAPWYYHRVVKDSHGRSHIVEETEMPKMSIVITGDENEDKRVDWQDGAIAFRSIMNNPYKSEEVPELVAWRIAMNFGGQAQNPFLTTLDNVKKVALHTDGLGQSVLLKGYGNEGHDSGHPDYGDIGKRIGGAKDMNTLMKEGKQYGARFGIHVNASEMYTEAKAFNEELVRRSGNNLSYGWNWLDQGIGIDGIYDLASGSREQRFKELKDQVKDNMDFIYLDVWGNNTASAEDSWETRKMSKMITDNGWRMTTEWGSGNEYDSTFQHWAADLTYGGSTSKGENSQVMRFLRNHQKDSWVGDYPSYGGAANAPLLGGYNMKDFEGWQGRNDYDAYITNLYTHDVSTKFIQHFKVMRWVNNPLDASAPVDENVNNGNEQIELKDDNENHVVISRGSNDTGNKDYRKRTITLNGKVVLDGHVSKGDGSEKGDESYLLPWNWDAQTGEFVSSDKEKLYHWNTKGGTTTWELPDSWSNLDTVKIYKLTDLGKTEEKEIKVNDGKITLNAKAETPYVVYKGKQSQMKIDWSTGMNVVDAGFNGGEESLKANWDITGKGNAKIEKSQHSNPMLKMSGDVSATQTLRDLEPGKTYALYLGVDNRSDDKASVSVLSNGKTLGTNYTEKSIAKNYVKAYSHNTNSSTVNGNSYFQNMYVYFEAPKDGSDVELVLQHEGEGDVYFDDIRVVENEAADMKVDENGELVSFTNDFENNVQGIYPFVVSGSEGVEDNRIHLSELHAPFTQAGWDVKKMDDVLDGNWSVKINGLTKKNTLVYQTIPQNIHFEPGVTYKVSFDYQSGSDDIYAVAIGNGEYDSSKVELKNLKKALGKDGHVEFELTGALNGDSWFGIQSTSTAPDLQGTSDAVANFGGYQDFVLDNLKVERVESKEYTKEEAQSKLDEMSAEGKYERENFSDAAWEMYQKTLIDVRVMLTKDGADSEDYTRAYQMLSALEAYMKTAPGTEAESKYDLDVNSYSVDAGSQYQNDEKQGKAIYAQDGDESTMWHTDWYSNQIENGNGWYEFQLNEPTTITGLRYLPRQSGENGKIKDYEIIVTTADASGKRSSQVIKGTFETSNAWQKASFKAIDNVVSVRLNVKTSIGDVDNKFASAAELRLTTKIDDQGGTEIPVDKSGLTAYVETIENQLEVLHKEDYTQASWNLLQAKLKEAKDILANKDASAYDVALAMANLETAFDGLTRVNVPSVDKTALNDLIKRADLIDTTRYTEESVNVFKKALDEAKEVYADENATQKQVDSAKTSLEKAMNGLQLKEETKVDKKALMDKLSTALRLDSKYYTVESWKVLEDAIANAQKVIDNEKATQQEVNEAYAALDKAITSLVLKEQGTLPEQKPEKPSSGDKDSSIENKDDVKTGVENNAKGLLAFALLSGGAIVSLLRKRRKLND